MAPTPEKPKTALILGAVIGGIALIALLAMAMTSSRTRTRSDSGAPESSAPPPPPVSVARPEDARPAPPVPPASSFAAELREIDDKMRTGLATEEFRQTSARARTG